MTRFLSITLLVTAALAGCTSPCMQVQQALCECVGKTQNERNTCEDAASAQEKLAPPTDVQLAACEQILTTCQDFIAKKGCEELQTREGRDACGIATK